MSKWASFEKALFVHYNYNVSWIQRVELQTQDWRLNYQASEFIIVESKYAKSACKITYRFVNPNCLFHPNLLRHINMIYRNQQRPHPTFHLALAINFVPTRIMFKLHPPLPRHFYLHSLPVLSAHSCLLFHRGHRKDFCIASITAIPFKSGVLKILGGRPLLVVLWLDNELCENPAIKYKEALSLYPLVISWSLQRFWMEYNLKKYFAVIYWKKTGNDFCLRDLYFNAGDCAKNVWPIIWWQIDNAYLEPLYLYFLFQEEKNCLQTYK